MALSRAMKIYCNQRPSYKKGPNKNDPSQPKAAEGKKGEGVQGSVRQHKQTGPKYTGPNYRKGFPGVSVDNDLDDYK